MHRRYGVRGIDLTRFHQGERDSLRQFCHLGGMVAFRPLQGDLTRAQRQYHLTGRPARIGGKSKLLAAPFRDILHAAAPRATTFPNASTGCADEHCALSATPTSL